MGIGSNLSLEPCLIETELKEGLLRALRSRPTTRRHRGLHIRIKLRPTPTFGRTYLPRL